MRDQIQGTMRNGTPRIDIGDISTRNNQITFMLRNPAQVDAARERLLGITGGGAKGGDVLARLKAKHGG